MPLVQEQIANIEALRAEQDLLVDFGKAVMT